MTGRRHNVAPHVPTSSCTASDEDRANRSPVHRGGSPMEMKIKCIGTYLKSDGTTDTVEIEKTITQDVIDQIRQEHVDLNRQIPPRGDFTDQNEYDYGHYAKMINRDLAGKRQAWITACNERERRPEGLADLTANDLRLTSGYRNPHHNVYHADADAVHGLHQYGRALDVAQRDIDGDNTNDPQKMAQAARVANPRALFTQVYSTTGHVHADWRPSGWPPSGIQPAPNLTLLEGNADNNNDNDDDDNNHESTTDSGIPARWCVRRMGRPTAVGPSRMRRCVGGGIRIRMPSRRIHGIRGRYQVRTPKEQSSYTQEELKASISAVGSLSSTGISQTC